MALEAATYINGLVSSNPPAGDPVTQADDHLRLIKATILATFPNLTGAVSVVQEKLNNSSPTGLISLWYGSTASVPTGWGLCDGSTYAKMDASGNIVAPDLRDRFVVGAGSTYAVAATGGATSGTSSATSAGVPAGTLDAQGAHTHTAATGSTVLDATMIPAHTHTVTAKQSGAAWGHSGVNNYPLVDATSDATPLADQTTPLTSSSIGGGLGHTHTIASDGSHTHTFTGSALATHTHTLATLPPYYALAYIMRL